jgi:hypothetical protein
VNEFEVPAEAWSDDRSHDVHFDAAPYLRQADETSIVSLYDCDFRGDYPADHVAEWSAGQEPELKALLDFVHPDPPPPTFLGSSIGWECAVDRDAALAFIRAERPEILPLIGQEPEPRVGVIGTPGNRSRPSGLAGTAS